MSKNNGTPLSAYLEILPKYTKRDYERRGEIIARTVNLERIIDTFIASYFCHEDKKRDELLLLILSTERITYENKRHVLKWICETYAKDLIKQYPTLFKDLQKIGEFRNILAHNHLDTDGFVQYETKQTTVINKYKSKKEVFEITEPIFKGWVELITKYHHILQNWDGTLYFPV